MKLSHGLDTYIKLNVGSSGHSVVVRLTGEHNKTRMSANVNDDPDGKILYKHNNTDEKEEAIKTQRTPNIKTDLNDTEWITSSTNIYYSL